MKPIRLPLGLFAVRMRLLSGTTRRYTGIHAMRIARSKLRYHPRGVLGFFNPKGIASFSRGLRRGYDEGVTPGGLRHNAPIPMRLQPFPGPDHTPIHGNTRHPNCFVPNWDITHAHSRAPARTNPPLSFKLRFCVLPATYPDQTPHETSRHTEPHGTTRMRTIRPRTQPPS
jgi:hypothetical protein